ALKPILATALELDVGARDSYLRQACGEDQELLRQAQSLIGAAEDHWSLPDIQSEGGRPAAAREHEAVNVQTIVEEGLQIGDRYGVVCPLGRGGMRSVYRVRDVKLDRDVALKLIDPDIAQDPIATERFKREILLSSSITHENVLRVYDLGENNGVLYLT